MNLTYNVRERVAVVRGLEVLEEVRAWYTGCIASGFDNEVVQPVVQDLLIHEGKLVSVIDVSGILREVNVLPKEGWRGHFGVRPLEVATGKCSC